MQLLESSESLYKDIDLLLGEYAAMAKSQIGQGREVDVRTFLHPAEYFHQIVDLILRQASHALGVNAVEYLYQFIYLDRKSVV